MPTVPCITTRFYSNPTGMDGHYKRGVPKWRTWSGSNRHGTFVHLIKSQGGQPIAQQVHVF